jgi:outer membrane protein assembly factor BamB
VLFHHQSYSLVLVTDLQGKPLWHYGLTRDTGGAWGLPADVDGDGKQEVLSVQPDGVIRCFAAEAAGERCPRCPPEVALTDRSRAGRPRWELDMKGPVSRLIGADLDGDGRWEVLFGDGKGLHALGERKGKPRLLWSAPFDRRVGEPILADADGDGRPEILVPVEDGRLYCLRSRSPRR